MSWKTVAGLGLLVALLANAPHDNTTPDPGSTEPATVDAINTSPEPEGTGTIDDQEPITVDVDLYDQPHYVADCTPDGDLIQVDPDTPETRQLATAKCQDTADWTSRFNQEMERRYPGEGWHVGHGGGA